MSELVETLASYIPTLVVRRLASNPALSATPIIERFQAAVLFADISGFTPLAERLAERGPAGAEELTRILNAYFGELVDLILALGGDVIKFAGDAALALWPATQEDLVAATRRAAQCGLALQMMLQNFRQDVHLSMRVGIGAGDVVAASLGGLRGRWEFLIAGQPLIQMGAANRQAQPGEVALSPEAYQLVQAHCAGQPLPNGGLLLKDVPRPLPFRLAEPLPLGPEMLSALRGYVPGAILARLDAGQTDWLAEIRRVTVLFVNLPAVPTALELGQIIMQEMQTILYRYEGSVRQFIVDDKGATLIAVLGLPPLAHADDAARGALAAMEMSAELRRLGLRGAIGVTSGQVYCSLIGNARRREYAVIGDVVNLSARLMAAASRGSEKKHLLILCDQATYQAARTRVEFEALSPITVKGKAAPIAVYRPLGQKKAALRPRSALVGRTNERIALADALQALLARNCGQAILLEGEAGIGKSRMVQELYRQAEAFRVTVFYGAGSAIEQTTPYYAWREIISQVLSIEGEAILPFPTLQARQAHILAQLEKLEGASNLAPLLNPILLVNFQDNDLTAQMSGQVRADNTHDLVLRLLQDAASRAPRIIILEDAHWMDAASWELAALVNRRVCPLLIVIVTRPLGAGWQLKAEPPPEYQQLLDSPNARHIRLEELGREETVELVCQRLGVASLSEPLVNLIFAKVEGHPFFAEELAFALRDSGLLQIAGDECRLARGAEDWRSVELPPTVHGAITSRIDRLAPGEQLALKVASVIGRVFDVRMLRNIYPIENDKPHLADYLRRLEHLDLVTSLARESPNGQDDDGDYTFKHTITLDVVYNLMSFAQRQKLHRDAAEWYERTSPDNFYYGVLVHHWTQAGDVPKALDYLEKAGEEALRNGAHQEAVHFFTEALELDRTTRQAGETAGAPAQPALPPQLRQARWERHLSEAYDDAGNVTASFMHARRAIELLGQVAPSTRTDLSVGIAREVLRQGLHRLWPGRFLGQRQGNEYLQELGGAYYRLAMVHYLNNQALPGMYANLCALNLFESANLRSSELARQYVNTFIGFGALALHPAARLYRRLAQQAVQEAGSMPTRAYMLQMFAWHDVGVGEWTQAKAELEEAVQLYDQLGDWRWWGWCLNILSLQHYYHGEFAPLAEIGAKECELGSQRANVQLQTWGLNVQAMHALQTGQSIDQAIASLEGAWELLTTHNLDRITAVLNRSILAVACLRQGRLRSAREVAFNVDRFLGRSLPIWVVSLDGYAAMALVYLTLWETQNLEPQSFNPSPDSLAEVKGRALQACHSLHRYAQRFPIGRPRAWLYQGWYDWLNGRAARARAAWHKALDYAGQLDMPYEEGLVHYEIGRHASGSERQSHLSRASEILAQLGAAYDLARVQAALEEIR